jgi:hypothetical protein
MTQTSNRFFDEMARLMNDAAGVAQGVRREFDTLFRNQAERILRHAEQRGEKPHPAGGLLSGAFELVVKDRILERGQVECGSVVHQADTDAIREAVAQKTVA